MSQLEPSMQCTKYTNSMRTFSFKPMENNHSQGLYVALWIIVWFVLQWSCCYGFLFECSRDGDWWLARNMATNKQGFIPNTYVALENSIEQFEWVLFDVFSFRKSVENILWCSDHIRAIICDFYIFFCSNSPFFPYTKTIICDTVFFAQYCFFVRSKWQFLIFSVFVHLPVVR